MAHILVVEDETDLAALLEYNLKNDGHTVVSTPLGEKGLSLAQNGNVDLVLLDLMLPDIGGGEVAQSLKNSAQTKDIPIIMLTAKAEEADRISGLTLGADDYVVKPFSVKELLLRVKAVLKRGDTGPVETSATLAAGSISLDSVKHEVQVSGQQVPLTALEFRLLKILLLRPNEVQTRKTLLNDVWNIQADIMTRTVDTHVKRLREKLGIAGDIIETIRGVGYRLNHTQQ